MGEGIKIMLPHKDVSDTNNSDIAYSSADSHLNVKLFQSPTHFGTLNYTFTSKPADPSSGQTAVTPLVSIVHGLGYVPASAVFMFVQSINNNGDLLPSQSYYPIPISLNTGSGSFSQSMMDYYVDSNILQIYYSVTSGGNPSKDPTGMSFIFKYYVFANPGA